MRDSGRQGSLWRWGHTMYRLRWVIVLVWAILFGGLVHYAYQLPEHLQDSGFTPRSSETEVGFTLLQERLDTPPSMLNLVYTSASLNLTGKKEIETILASLADVKTLPYVRDIKINESKRSPDQLSTQSVNIELKLNRTQALDKYPDIRNRISAPPGMKVYANGPIATLYDVRQATKKDLGKSELLGLPIALIVLLLIFGTLSSAVLPLIVAIVSVVVTMGITFFIAQHYSLSSFLPNMVTMIGLAVALDYALLVVSRFREELKQQPSVNTAVAATSQMAGKSIIFSGFAVLIGMFGMLFINSPVMHSLCLGGVLVVLLSVITTNTLLLALLSILGHKINSLRVFPTLQQKRANSKLWERIAFTVMKYPVLLVVLMTTFMIWLMLPIGGMRLGLSDAEVLPPSYESRVSSDLLKRLYDEREANPILVLVDTPGEIWQEPSIRQIQDYSDKIRATPNVSQVNSFISLIGNHPSDVTAVLLQSSQLKQRVEQLRLAKSHTALLVVVPTHGPESAQTGELIHQLRSLDSGSLRAVVTGGAAYRVDILDRINQGMPLMVGFVMAVTYVILLIAFKSVLLPLKAVLMNLLSLGSSLGILVTVFQKGWMAQSLHITATGYVNIILPVTIFCVVFGISMDYEVFMISRIMEEYEKTGDNERSTAEGLQKTGSIITSAAFILIVVVGSFIFTDIEITKALGIGLFCAVLIDATLIRVIVVPALMKLLGRANWWAPRWLGR